MKASRKRLIHPITKIIVRILLSQQIKAIPMKVKKKTTPAAATPNVAES
jgi:hypothetical protein